MRLRCQTTAVATGLAGTCIGYGRLACKRSSRRQRFHECRDLNPGDMVEHHGKASKQDVSGWHVPYPIVQNMTKKGKQQSKPVSSRLQGVTKLSWSWPEPAPYRRLDWQHLAKHEVQAALVREFQDIADASADLQDPGAPDDRWLRLKRQLNEAAAHALHRRAAYP